MQSDGESTGRKHYEGDGCSEEQHEEVVVYPYQPRETLADALRRIESQRDELRMNRPERRSGW